MNKTQESKCDLIKTAIKSGKKIPFKSDHDVVLYWWEIINDVLFDNILKEPEQFVFKKFHKKMIGFCVPYRFNNKKNRRVRIGINRIINNLHDFLCVLIHEMVHQWEWEILGKWNDKVAHGKEFYSWRQKVKELTGAPLTKSYNVNLSKHLSW